MIDLIKQGVYLLHGTEIRKDATGMPSPDEARENTITYGILRAHDVDHSKGKRMRIKFDAMMSHDITYVGIIQTARASGLEKFPLPYAMTNCHNSLCAVGGTINEDDHVFGLSAAKKYGGIYVPANQAVIHQFAREEMVKCGNMILGSDSHTRYGSLGNMGVGEGGGELVKQLLNNTWDINAPEVVLVWLEGSPRKGIGPHDVAISLVKATFESGFVKNKVLEFAGPGVKNLPIDFRNGIDIMTTETTCLSSIWITDDEVKHHYEIHKRPADFKVLQPGDVAYYDAMIRIDLSTQESMIALPYHPSHAFTIHELQENPIEILHQVEEDTKRRYGEKVHCDLVDKVHNGKVMADQGIIAGCAGGTYDNLAAAAAIMNGKSIGNSYFTMSAYPQSVPVFMAAARGHIIEELLETGCIIKPAFCGPCFGAGDVPANNGLSIRHTTRNFPNREGSKPGEGQISAVALMDARSIAATAANGGYLTAASEVCDSDYAAPEYHFDQGVYDKRVYNGWGHPEPDYALKFGPNIKDWPEQPALTDDLLVKIVSYITDPVTTTDELIPSGETSSFRSNPLRLAEFTLSRKDPAYVPNAKAVHALDEARRAGALPEEVAKVYAELEKVGYHPDAKATNIGSAIFANKPGDGSAREQAASCQRVLGGAANFACEYATKRYRSNCINWGMLPFLLDTPNVLDNGDYVFLPGVRKALLEAADVLEAVAVKPDGGIVKFTVRLGAMTDAERQILADGCLINYYKNH